MRRSIVAAAAIAVAVSIGAPTKNAAAMPVVTPSQLGLAGGAVDSVEKTVLICGPWAAIGAPIIRDGTGPTRIRTPIGVGAAITGGAGTAIGAAGDRPIAGSHASAP
jgi:hypothetical protein